MNRKRASGSIVIWGAVVLGVVGIVATLQRQMIYFPAVAGEEQLLQEASRAGMRPWRAPDGELIGWRTAEPRGTGPRMLVFHGNAGYALHRTYYVQGFAAQPDNWEVFLFEYPGYGARAGSPSESEFKEAAASALGLLLQDPGPVYLTGESLGSGVASYLAGTYPDEVAGVLLVTPFASLTEVAAHHFPYLPVRLLLQDRYNSVEALSGYSGPVAFLLAGEDEVVPVESGQRLYESYGGARWLRVFPSAGHNTLPLRYREEWWREVSAFLQAPAPGSN